MDPERQRLLVTLGFELDPLESRWLLFFEELIAFKGVHGHLVIPREKAELYEWAMDQRERYKSNKLGTDRTEKLNEAGFIWDVKEYQWQKSFACLLEFYEGHGHFLVPRSFEQDGFKLGMWVKSMRNSYKAGSLSPEKEALLNSVGFIWDTRRQQPEAKKA